MYSDFNLAYDLNWPKFKIEENLYFLLLIRKIVYNAIKKVYN